jgi:carboxyl-terminal processing protease
LVNFKILPISTVKYFLIYFVILIFPVVPDSNARQTWFTNEEMVNLYEALGAIQDESFYKIIPKDMTNEVIGSFLKRIDPYARWFPADEYATYNKSLASTYGGVGMEVEENETGEFHCQPFPNSPADQAGILGNDQLLLIDGCSTKGLDLLMVGARIRGPINSQVTLGVRSNKGPVRKITLQRELTDLQTIITTDFAGLKMFRILRFSRQTPDELARLLKKIDTDELLLLDLRGNRGGELNAAVRSASLLLPGGTEILVVQTESDSQVMKSDSGTHQLYSKVILLQDKWTASAAEVFIAALVHNKAAVSVGTRSYGKGVAQRFVPLSGGGALLMSYAKLIPPNRIGFDKEGLAPSFQVRDAGKYGAVDKAYAEKVMDILSCELNKQQRKDQ